MTSQDLPDRPLDDRPLQDRPLHDRHRRVLPRWVTTYYEQPLHPVSATGRVVTDAHGRDHLDFFAGILTNSLGYDVADFRRALDRQLDTGIVHTSTLYLIDAQVRLAERLAEQSGIDDAVVFFVNSGTEANDTALLAATCHTGSNHVIALTDSYHGRSLTSTAVSGLPGWRPSPYSPFQVTFASNGRTSPSDDEHPPEDPAADLEAQLAGQAPPAALIVEPVQGLGGFHTPPTALLQRYARIAADHGAVLICDEVQTAWGRTGRAWWGHQLHRLKPDVITFAKGIANGLPLGGVIARRDILDSVAGKSISTFGGNPLACTAALATLDHIHDHDLQRNAETAGQSLLAQLRRLAADHPHLADARGQGLMLAVDIVDPRSGRPDPDAARAHVETCRAQGLLIGLGGRHGNTLRIAPPLTVTRDEIEEATRILAAAARHHTPAPATA
ncbi:aspartate aminotransferase family protein [Streptomyces griseosporeus]|uniref:aspartate aminotransferase family protein n=1 Tax=Streptomyces griseosporeus TaxID=1910 RepID=UPI00167EC1A9|nr:aminotransferase class III-fold pyridoxal phosphate-dependent enzyme [Streptomyces griseosporeus]GHF51184.1 aminotransferase [Streptomyces griseosporeus]